METYLDFLTIHKPDKGDAPRPTQKVKDEYRSQVGEPLLELWDKVGFASFHDGLFWLVSPDEWRKCLSGFEVIENENPIPFLRSSFGNIVYSKRDGSIFQLTPIVGDNSEVVFSLDFYFLASMKSETYYKEAFFSEMHKQALKKLGKIKSDEVYGFEPLLSLGGSEGIESMVKVKAREHLSLIAQTL